VLLIQDTTWLDYVDHPATSGLGWAGRNGDKGKPRGRSGLFLHAVLAVEPTAARGQKGLRPQGPLPGRETAAAAGLGSTRVWVAPRGGRPGRWAHVKVAGGAVTLYSPQLSRTGHALRVWAVRVFEPDPPPGQKALEWMLLTDRPGPVESADDALEVAGWYAQRWLVHLQPTTQIGRMALASKSTEMLSGCCRFCPELAGKVLEAGAEGAGPVGRIRRQSPELAHQAQGANRV
jgi:hypothetical protein